MNNKFILMTFLTFWTLTSLSIQTMNNTTEEYVEISSDGTQFSDHLGYTKTIKQDGTTVIRHEYSGCSHIQYSHAQVIEDAAHSESEFEIIKKSHYYPAGTEVITDANNNIRSIYYANGDCFFDQECDRQFLRKDDDYFVAHRMKKDQPGTYFKNGTRINPEKLFENIVTHQCKQGYINIQDVVSNFMELCKNYKNEK